MMLDDAPFGLTLLPDRVSRHSVGIHASPAEVWRALTDPGETARWFVSEAAIDLRPEGAFRWVFGRASGDPGPHPIVTEGTCAAVARHELLRLRAVIDEIETQIEFRLDPWRDGAIVTLSHTGFPGDEDWDDTFGAIDRGWRTELHVLKIYLERGRGMERRAERHVRRFPARAENLFDAFATQSGLEGWVADRAAVDATPGGTFRIEREGRETLDGHYAVYEPDHFLVMTCEVARPSVVRVHIEETDDDRGVEVTLDHIRLSPSPGGDPEPDWEAALDRLGAWVRLARAT